MFVLITVPHRFCIAKITRTCDLRAESSSKLLINILNKRKIKNETVKMSVPRIDVDFNRMKPRILENTKKYNKIHKLPLNYKRTKLYTANYYKYKSTNTQEIQSAQYIKDPESTSKESNTQQLETNNAQQQPIYTNTQQLATNNAQQQPIYTQQQQNKIYKDLNYYKKDYYHNNTIDNKNKLVSKYWDQFNNKIIKIIKDEKAKKHKILLLDIHSFPKGSFDGAQIAIIDIYKTNRTKLDKFVIHIINKMHIDIRVFNGLDNYIQNTYKKSTYPLLLEFCEDRTYLLNETIKLFFEELLNYFILE